MDAYGINSGLLEGLDEVFFPSVCSVYSLIQDDTEETGQPTDQPETEAVISNVKCRRGPIIKERPQSQESEQNLFTRKYQKFHVLMRGLQSSVTQGMLLKFADDPKYYDIRTVEADGSGVNTRIGCQFAEPA